MTPAMAADISDHIWTLRGDRRRWWTEECPLHVHPRLSWARGANVDKGRSNSGNDHYSGDCSNQHEPQPKSHADRRADDSRRQRGGQGEANEHGPINA
jgi:hypothetical protein